MNKLILPFHKTGWLYLILLLWLGSYWYQSEGGFSEIKQFNIDLLFKSKGDASKGSPNNIANIQSTFEDHDLDDIIEILDLYPNATVALLGNLSKSFTQKLQTYLESHPRKSKLIIGSGNWSSALSVAGNEEVTIDSVLDSIRYTNNPKVNRLTSSHFVFTPIVDVQAQRYTLFWRENHQTYLTLAGEVLRQMVLNHNIQVHKGWHIELSATHKDTDKIWPLGFNGEIYTQSRTELATPLRYFLDYQKDYMQASLTNVNSDKIASNSPTPYGAIIISEGKNYAGTLSARLLDKLINHQYLYQTLPIIILSWLILIIGVLMLWFILQLSSKKQVVVIVTYTILVTALQYYIFTIQQWIPLLPTFSLLALTWALLMAYQSENRLFIAAYKHRGGNNAKNLINNNATAKKMAKPVSKKLNQSKKSLTPAAKISKVANAINHNTAQNASSNSLDATMVMSNEQKKSVALAKDQQLQMKNFGRYQVEGILGKGAMGIVYQGVDPKINRHVAIKTLQLNNHDSEQEYIEAKERFFKEAQTAGGLSHANIVTIYDVGEEDNLGYIAMDLLTGAPLSVFIKPDNLLPSSLVYQLMIQITDALEYAHQQNVVHRDIKPANIIYDDDLLKVTVTDFGIAYVSDNSKTKTGVIMGSPYYMSPEQILGLQVDGRSDIFSLGVTFYQLLSGELPFKGESIATVAYQITKSKATAVTQVNSQLPASALRITNKAMHKDISKRYQTMAEFKQALENALKRDFKNV